MTAKIGDVVFVVKITPTDSGVVAVVEDLGLAVTVRTREEVPNAVHDLISNYVDVEAKRTLRQGEGEA